MEVTCKEVLCRVEYRCRAKESAEHWCAWHDKISDAEPWRCVHKHGEYCESDSVRAIMLMGEMGVIWGRIVDLMGRVKI